MLISSTVDAISEKIGFAGAIRLLNEAGFDAYDMSFFEQQDDPDGPLNIPDWREQLAEQRAFADMLGIVCNQAHAPFPSSVGDEARDKEIYDRIVRAIEGAAILGAKIIVVHPRHFLHYPDHVDELYRMNLEFYRSLIPYCEKFGIKVAIENMWTCRPGTAVILPDMFAGADEFCRFLDEIGSPWIVGCLDLGHTVLGGVDPARSIRRIGAERLQSLHVHDNDLYDDSHALPYTERMDFAPILAALKEIGYKGDYTMEIPGYFKKTPEPLLPAAAAHACLTAKYQRMQIVSESF